MPRSTCAHVGSLTGRCGPGATPTSARATTKASSATGASYRRSTRIASKTSSPRLRSTSCSRQ
eukprot:7380374-Prymnesium_polylepis.2